MKVVIKDYQAIKDVTLDLTSGVTAIIGQTNNGKSSIIRAIRGAVNNQGGTDFINYDAEHTSVTIEYNNNEIVWEKHRKQGKSSYTINGNKLTKIGQTQLPEVAELLNMGEVSVGNERFQINFWKQLEKPFLVDKTAYQLFDFISKSREQELVTALQEEKEAELKEISKQINSLNANADLKTQEELKLVEEIKELEIFNTVDVDRLIVANELISKLNTKLDTLYKLNEQLITLQSTYDTLVERTQKLSDLLEPVEEQLTLLDKLKSLKDELDTNKITGQALTSKYKELTDFINLHNNTVDQVAKLLDTLSASKQEVEVLSNKLNTLDTYKTTLNKQLEKIATVHSDIKAADDELATFEVCPLCGNSLATHTH